MAGGMFGAPVGISQAISDEGVMARTAYEQAQTQRSQSLLPGEMQKQMMELAIKPYEFQAKMKGDEALRLERLATTAESQARTRNLNTAAQRKQLIEEAAKQDYLDSQKTLNNLGSPDAQAGDTATQGRKPPDTIESMGRWEQTLRRNGMVEEANKVGMDLSILTARKVTSQSSQVSAAEAQLRLDVASAVTREKAFRLVDSPEQLGKFAGEFAKKNNGALYPGIEFIQNAMASGVPFDKALAVAKIRMGENTETFAQRSAAKVKESGEKLKESQALVRNAAATQVEERKKHEQEMKEAKAAWDKKHGKSVTVAPEAVKDVMTLLTQDHPEQLDIESAKNDPVKVKQIQANRKEAEAFARDVAQKGQDQATENIGPGLMRRKLYERMKGQFTISPISGAKYKEADKGTGTKDSPYQLPGGPSEMENGKYYEGVSPRTGKMVSGTWNAATRSLD